MSRMRRQGLGKLLFLTGFGLGIMVLSGWQQVWLGKLGLWDRLSLYSLQGFNADGKQLFFYVLKCRLGTLLLLTVLFYTAAGLVSACLWFGWLGFSAGFSLCALCFRFGIRGILIFLAGIFPQILLLAPAWWLFFLWGTGLWFRLYLPGAGHEPPGVPQHAYWEKKGLKLLGIFTLVAAACALESYISPLLLKIILNLL